MRIWSCLSALLVVTSGATAANSQPVLGIYIGNRHVLQADPPRQLSLNANVQEFAFQPMTASLAYVAVHDEAGARTISVRLVSSRVTNGAATTLCTFTGDAPDLVGSITNVPAAEIIGWSASGRYLLVHESSYSGLNDQMLSIDVDAQPPHARQVVAAHQESDGFAAQSTAGTWSPNHERILLRCIVTTNTPDTKTEVDSTSLVIYDPASDTSKPITLPAGYVLDALGTGVGGRRIAWLAWLDNQRLYGPLARNAPNASREYVAVDVATGAVTAIPPPTAHELGLDHDRSVPPDTADRMIREAGLVLQQHKHPVDDPPDKRQGDVTALWIAKAKPPKLGGSVAPVAIATGSADPQAAWAPDGMAVGYISHGDLFVANLGDRDASASETAAAGDPVSCREETLTVMRNMKLLGLGLIQYTQDNDEHLPPASKFHDAVAPYVQDDSVFSFGNMPVQYHAPTDLSVVKMENPSEAVLATFETPCAHIVLYADGHVKSTPR